MYCQSVYWWQRLITSGFGGIRVNFSTKCILWYVNIFLRFPWSLLNICRYELSIRYENYTSAFLISRIRKMFFKKVVYYSSSSRKLRLLFCSSCLVYVYENDFFMRIILILVYFPENKKKNYVEYCETMNNKIKVVKYNSVYVCRYVVMKLTEWHEHYPFYIVFIYILSCNPSDM